MPERPNGKPAVDLNFNADLAVAFRAFRHDKLE